MYVYIDLARAKEDGKIEFERLDGWFKFFLSDERKVGGHTTDGKAHLDCKVVPEEARPYLTGFYTEKVEWEDRAHRYTGVYRLGEATGTLEHREHVRTVGEYSSEGQMHIEKTYNLSIESGSIEDCNELIRLIRAGKIVPVDNWEAEAKAPTAWTVRQNRLSIWWQGVVRSFRNVAKRA